MKLFLKCWIAVVFFSAAVTARSQEVNLVLLGDWGATEQVKGKKAGEAADFAAHRLYQRRTAKLLGDWLVKNSAVKMDGMLLLGDNFYGPLTGVDDERWTKTFLNNFPKDKFPMKLFVALGNHDFEDGENWRAEIDYARAKKDERWLFPTADNRHTWYRLDLPSKNEALVTVMVLNTSYDHILAKKAQKNGIADWEAQKVWLAHELSERGKAPWLAAAGHYPMFTNGHHYPDTLEGGDDHDCWKKGRADLMQPMLSARAQFWIGGHDHNLQFLHDKTAPGMDFIVSGGGAGDSLYKISQPHKPVDDLFIPPPGWVWMAFTKDTATTRFYHVSLGSKSDGSADSLEAKNVFVRKLADGKSTAQ